jgi:ATP-dependent Zn protease
LAARQAKSVIEEEDLEEARDKIMMLIERESLILTKKELKLNA